MHKRAGSAVIKHRLKLDYGPACVAGVCKNTNSLAKYPIGPFTVDFLCREARLVVEVDGATHSTDTEIAYDGRRTAYLKSQGYRIVRILNDDIYRHFDDVMDMILLALEGKIPEAQ